MRILTPFLTDVVASIKTLIKSPDDQLTVEERNLLSIAFKNLTAQLRNQWRIIDTLEKKAAARSTPQQVALMHLQKERIRRELEGTCMEIVELLEKFLINSANPGEEKVFYSKMLVEFPPYFCIGILTYSCPYVTGEETITDT